MARAETITRLWVSPNSRGVQPGLEVELGKWPDSGRLIQGSGACRKRSQIDGCAH